MMISGEFASLSEIYKWSPAFTPTPYATGQFRDSSIPTYFLLMEFVEMQTGPPEPANFMKQLADLHNRSTSPNGQFGFHTVTCVGPNAQDVTWDSSWSAFYTKLLRLNYDRELRVCGPSRDGRYEAEMEKLIARTVPAMLEPLQAHGRTLKPSLVHGDLWEENTGTEFESGQPKIFDAAVLYAHNEYDFAAWRSDNVPFGRPYYKQYLRHIPPSEPKEQWDDRNKLYAIRAEVHHSSLWPSLCDGQRDMYAALTFTFCEAS
jgi:protein-ribulosamine 3-kinase